MPDKRKHRGAHPRDESLFSSSQAPRLREARRDLTWLLSRGYPERAALKLVGDRFRLQQRQRLAVSRSACSRQAAGRRRQRMLPPADLAGQPIRIDGFNLLITIESALSDGLILAGFDGCYRDLASIHGSYRRVEETEDAIRLIGSGLRQLDAGPVHWLLDRPVSNSGKLLSILYAIAEDESWNWEVSLLHNPDHDLMNTPDVVVSSDSVILDHVARWFNMAAFLIDHFLPRARIIRLG